MYRSFEIIFNLRSENWNYYKLTLLKSTLRASIKMNLYSPVSIDTKSAKDMRYLLLFLQRTPSYGDLNSRLEIHVLIVVVIVAEAAIMVCRGKALQWAPLPLLLTLLVLATPALSAAVHRALGVGEYHPFIVNNSKFTKLVIC